MKRLAIMTIGLIFILAGCKKSNPLEDFLVLKVTENADLVITAGETATLETALGDEAEQYFTTNQDTLIIFGNADLNLTLTDVSKVIAIIVDSNANVVFDTNTTWKFNTDLKLTVIGNGDLILSVNTSNLVIYLNDNADLTIKGDTISNVVASILGNSDYMAYNMPAVDYSILAKDDANAYIYAINSITGEVRDNADVYYKGNPTSINVIVDSTAYFGPEE